MANKIYLTEIVLLTKSYNLQDFKDWMHWHLDICKFDHIQVFDNASTVDIKSVCDSYGDRVTYTYIENVNGYQYLLYNDYVNNHSKSLWVLPIDDDEFLYMKKFTNVNDMIIHYQTKWEDMNKLSIRWKNMFPKDPQADRGDKSLMEFNTEENEIWANLFDGGNKPVKTFCKTTAKFNHTVMNDVNHCHNPLSSDNQNSYMCNGDRLYGSWYYGEGDDDLRLLHYQYKSKKEWVWKCMNRKPPCGGYDYMKFVNIPTKMK